MNGLNSFDKTDRIYSQAPTNDHIRFWRSKVMVTLWFKYVVVKACHNESGALKYNFRLFKWLSFLQFRMC